MQRSHKFPNLIPILLMAMFGSLQAVNARTRMYEPSRHDHPEADRFSEMYMIVRNVILVSISPVIVSFLISVYRDPATPLILQAIVRSFKRRMLGDLKRMVHEEEDEARHPIDVRHRED